MPARIDLKETRRLIRMYRPIILHMTTAPKHLETRKVAMALESMTNVAEMLLDEVERRMKIREVV